DGTVAGSPGSSGVFTFTAQATDSLGIVATRQFTWTVNATTSIVAVAPQQWTRDRPYSLTLHSAGGTPPMTWSLSDPLPTGLSLGAGAVVSGTPTVLGTSTIDVTVRDSIGVVAAASIPLKIVDAPHIDATFFADWTEATPFLKTMTVSAGTPPYAWSVAS